MTDPSGATMRVALVTKGFAMSNNDYCLPPLIDLVRSLSDRVQFDVYALNYPFERRSYDVFGARVHAYGFGRFSSLRARLTVTRRVQCEHARQPYDLVHAVWADQPGSLAAGLAARLDRPLVTTLYAGEAVWLPRIGYGSLAHPRRKAELAKVLAQSAAVIAGSSGLAAMVRDSFGCPVTAIPLGYDPQRFCPEGPREALGPGRHVVTVASFSPVKGLGRLVDALSTISERQPRLLEGVTWHIVGPDPRNDDLRRHLSARIAALPIRLHPGRPQWEMPAMLRAADLVCVPSYFESQCFAAIEAAACGTPVMGTSVGILPELASSDWVCPAPDDEALTALIARVLAKPQGWAEACASQQAWLADNAPCGIARDRYHKLYRRVVQGEGGV